MYLYEMQSINLQYVNVSFYLAMLNSFRLAFNVFFADKWFVWFGFIMIFITFLDAV